jgi:predicted phosphoribosyltransferase
MTRIIEEVTFRNTIHVFTDRQHAGVLLANHLIEYEGRRNTSLLAIPAGGVQVAIPISQRLKLPLDLAITRKLHVPWNKEAGFGAISWDGLILLNNSLVASLGLRKEEIERCIVEERKVIQRRCQLFRQNKPFPNLKDHTVIIIDDGLASGFSMLTTIKALEKRNVKEIIVAVPTAPLSTVNLITPNVALLVCLNIRSGPFFAVADAYKEWYDLEDEDIIHLLQL